MIKWIVSDLDGTLFEGHGETVFDLSPANEAALQAVQNAGIEFSAASGRMIGYGIHLLEKYGFPHIRTAGFNGAVCYDQGQFVVTHALAIRHIRQIVEITRKACPQCTMIQVQGLNSERILANLQDPIAEHYRKECAKLGIGQVMDFTLDQYLDDSQGILAGKLSLTFDSQEACLAARRQLSEPLDHSCFIAQSGERLLEIGSGSAHKGVFIDYLKQTYSLRANEIAVIGDSLNDAEMFAGADHTFAMQSGSPELQRKAGHIVESAADAINWCLDYNVHQA